MTADAFAALGRLADDELVSRLVALAGREREASAEGVAHLSELERRGLHLKAGYGSLFAYCREALLLAEADSFNRIEVARAARRFPAVLELLAEGSVNLTTVRLLSPHLTRENHRAVLDSARGKKRAEVEEIVARLAPRPDAPAWLRKLPGPRVRVLATVTVPRTPTPPPEAAAGPAAPPTSPFPGDGPGPLASAAATPSPVEADASALAPPAVAPLVPDEPASRALPSPPAPGRTVSPLSPDRYRLQLTIGPGTLDKLLLARDMLSHVVPAGDDAAVLDRALTALLVELARQRFAATDRPRPSPGTSPGSRHVPAEVKRAVWVRDAGRCAFVGEGGRRCEERRFLEFHHRRPHAVGGEATVANIELRCRGHNDHEARVYFAREEEIEAPRP